MVSEAVVITAIISFVPTIKGVTETDSLNAPGEVRVNDEAFE